MTVPNSSKIITSGKNLEDFLITTNKIKRRLNPAIKVILNEVKKVEKVLLWIDQKTI
jgi:hypothetical protein